MKKSKVLYTDLDIEKCRQRFNEDINAYGSKRFYGKIFNNDFYVVYVARSRAKNEYELRANLKQDGERTQIKYELSGGINKKYYLFYCI